MEGWIFTTNVGTEAEEREKILCEVSSSEGGDGSPGIH